MEPSFDHALAPNPGHPLIAAGNPYGNPFPNYARAVEMLIDEAAEQHCGIVFAAYPNRNVFTTGLNGTFDPDIALERAESEAALDLLTPLEDTEHADLEGDIVADHVFAHEFDREIPHRNIRQWVDQAERSSNAVEYYELVDGDIHHERTYHEYDSDSDPLGFDELSDALKDATVDADEIVEQLEAEAAETDNGTGDNMDDDSDRMSSGFSPL